MRPHPIALCAALAALATAACAPATFSPAAASPAGTASAPGAPAAGLPRRHSIDRLYAYPRLIGTAPGDPAWSPDGRRVAFLWNDAGEEFRDVWIADAADPRPRRLTTLPRAAVPAGDAAAGDAVAAVERTIAVERQRGAAALQWTPDGTRLLFTLDGALHALAPGATPTRLAAAPGAMSQLTFSPDGAALAFVRGGRVWVGALAGDSVRARPLGDAPASGVGLQSFRWAPDGRSLAVVEVDRRAVPVRPIPDYLREEPALVRVPRPYPGDEAGRRRVGLLDVATGETRWLALDGDPADLVHGYAWSPDGSALAVDRSDLYVKDRRLLLADARTGAVRRLYREADSLNVTAQWQVAWAPDGRGVYFTSDRDDHYHVYHLPVTGGVPTRVTAGDWAVFSFEVSPAAGALFVVGNRGRAEERHVYRVPLAGGEAVRVSGMAGNHDPYVSPDGRWAAVRFSSDTVPPDLWLTRLDATEGAAREVRVTTSPIAEFGDYRWVGASYVTFPSHVDGTTLHGRLILPPDFDPTRRYPAVLGSSYSNTVLNQWGGRSAHPNWGIDQYLAQQGFVILQVDVRGSAGHGRAYRRGIRLDYGGIDVEDLHSGVLHLATLGYVDTSRVGLWGSSYGGLLTAMSLFRKPGVYRAGVAGAPATNVRHALTGEMRVMETPQARGAAYDRASAVSHAAGLRDRLLLLHGMRDATVLFHDSMTLLHRLILLERDVDVVVLPDAQHAWTQEGSPQVRYAYRKVAEYLERHVRDTVP